MTTGATSLALVRDELFTTMEQSEQLFEQFLTERNNGSHLQQAIEGLKQIRGILSLIELAGAELLVQEIYLQASNIPLDASVAHDSQLSSLSTALFVLRRYLESIDLYRQEMPQLLLPTINELRLSSNRPALPESFFFSVQLDTPRPRTTVVEKSEEERHKEARYLRHLYQLGLLGYLRDAYAQAGLKLMGHAMRRLDSLFAAGERSRLCWISAAALEAHIEGRLLPRQSRKLLLARLDRELKQLMVNPQYEPPRYLLKELLYLVALADTAGPLSTELRQVFGFNSLPFNERLLEDAYQRLGGPGQAVLRSLSSAIQEEIVIAKDYVDLIERGTAPEGCQASLHAGLGKLSKTLTMVGLNSVGKALQEQMAVVAGWMDGQPIIPQALLKLADTVLYAEGMVASLESGRQWGGNSPDAALDEHQPLAALQLREARTLVVDEAQAGIALSKRAITAYLASEGDRMHLANIPIALQAVRGGLVFIEQERAAGLLDACMRYIQEYLLSSPHMPSEKMLDSLADALASLEYYLEGLTLLRSEDRRSVLDVASASVKILGVER